MSPPTWFPFLLSLAKDSPQFFLVVVVVAVIIIVVDVVVDGGVCVCVYCSFETGSHYVTLASLIMETRLTSLALIEIRLLRPPRCWN